MADALDVANYQGAIDGAAIRDADTGRVGLVIVKVTEGTWSSNAYAGQQIGATLEAGMRVGAYHFPRPDRGAAPEAEADAFLANLGAVRSAPRPVLALDLEPYPGVGWPLDAGATVDWSARWLDRVAAAMPGAYVAWYSYPSFIATYLPRDERIDRYGCWIADPSAWANGFAPRTGGRPYFLHQIAVAPHAGVVGNVDINVYGPTYPDTITPAPPAKPRGRSSMFYAIIVNAGELPRTYEVDGAVILRELDYGAARGAYGIHVEALESGLPCRRVDDQAAAFGTGSVWDVLKRTTAYAQTPPGTTVEVPASPTNLTDAELIAELSRRLA